MAAQRGRRWDWQRAQRAYVRGMTSLQRLRSQVEIPEPAHAANRTPISAIMSRPLIHVTGETSIDTIADVLLARAISSVPVLDDAGKPIGIISKTDLLRERQDAGDTEERARRDPRDPRLEPGMHEAPVARRTAAEMMTPAVLIATESTTVSLASALMAYERVHRLIVVDEAGVAVGVVSTLDVLEWLARGDGYVIPHGRLPRR